MHDVIVVEISDQLAAGLGQRDVAGRTHTAALAAKAADARVVDAAEQCWRAIDAAVIDDQQLPAAVRLACTEAMARCSSALRSRVAARPRSAARSAAPPARSNP